jgi:hypothetical protein
MSPQEDALVAYLDSSRSCLKTDIKSLSALPSAPIEDQYLPNRTLMLEILSEGQIKFGELAIRSLRELLEYSDDVNYASCLTGAALSELSQTDRDALPYLLVGLENKACSSVSLPSPDANDDHNSGITPYLDYLIHSSPIDKEMDQFLGEDFFLS